MKRFLILSALVLGATVMGPVVVRAADGSANQKRYYDQKGKDYHTWNDNEDHAYRTYLTEQHQTYVAFGKAKRPQQQQYFAWRHQHPDDAVVKVEVR